MRTGQALDMCFAKCTLAGEGDPAQAGAPGDTAMDREVLHTGHTGDRYNTDCCHNAVQESVRKAASSADLLQSQPLSKANLKGGHPTKTKIQYPGVRESVFWHGGAFGESSPLFAAWPRNGR
jgi:hypothetical protein